MTLNEIKKAVKKGRKVYCGNTGYEVIDGGKAGLLINCISNGYCIGLTHADGVTMNGKPEDFFSLPKMATGETAENYMERRAKNTAMENFKESAESRAEDKVATYKFRKPTGENEKLERYELLEKRGDNGLFRCLSYPALKVKPAYTFPLKDLEKVSIWDGCVCDVETCSNWEGNMGGDECADCSNSFANRKAIKPAPAKHTPGPWKLDGTVVEAKWENGESVMVCQAGGTRWGGCPSATEYNKRMREENTANAALIAAAPELLAALEKGEDIISGIEAIADNNGIDMAEVREWWRDIAGPAIAKAKGDK